MMTSGPVIAMILMGSNVIAGWREMMGPTDPVKARSEAPSTVRARYGTDSTHNAVHGSDSVDTARSEMNFFFPEIGTSPQGTAKLTNCTLGIIKPHAVVSGECLESVTSFIIINLRYIFFWREFGLQLLQKM